MDKTTTAFSQSSSMTKIQDLLKAERLKALLIRSTDQYFNEYVPTHLSIRAKLTGFDGSVGDAIITTTGAHLFVDGRYSLQAKQQAKGFIVHVTGNAQSIENCWLQMLPQLISADDTIGYDPRTMDLKLFDRFIEQVHLANANVNAKGEIILKKLVADRENIAHEEKSAAFLAPESCTGRTSLQKLDDVRNSLKQNNINAFLAVKLDDISWLSNLRTHFFPFQSSIPSLACIFPERIILGINDSVLIESSSLPKNISLVPEHQLIKTIASNLTASGAILGIDAGETSKAHELALRESNIEVKRVANPIAPLKAIKNEKELLHFRSAFKKADQVVYQTQNFVIDCFEKGESLTEANVDDYVREAFKKSGAKELSFRPICASGKNGAIIHYGTPDHQQALQANSLFLLDTGAYYEAGYATDLTRTFLAGKKSAQATALQKEMFTLVLKASIAGLSARFRRGTLGMQIDALVRAPLWQRGLDFAHGTGHGVGISVHEFPPRIAPGSLTELAVGQVFSIEPGLYFENIGGVRIENLATVVPDQDNPNFLRILPLTFCPLDERLIENNMLDQYEQSFLAYFKKEWENTAPWPNLPPLPITSLL